MSDVNANIGVNIDSSQALEQLKVLQRQISEFNRSVSKSNEAAVLAQKSLQKNFINSINSIGAFSAELRTVQTTAESFTSALENNKLSMREYFKYAGAATKTFGNTFKSEFDTIGKVAEERVKTLQTQYIKMGRDANGAMKAIAVRPLSLDMNDLGTKTQIAAQKQAIFNQLLKQGSTNLLNFGKNTQWAGRQLMVGFTLPLAAFGATAAKAFQQLETEVIKFKKVYGDLGTSQSETDAALKNIKSLADGYTKYGVEVSKTVGLASQAAAAGFKGADLLAQTDAASKLAVLGQIDQQQALETTISLQNAFKISSGDLASTIDFLNAVENQTVTSLDDITTAIPKVAPVINALGGDVKDLAFFLTAMKEGGINASEGANALKSGLASLINPSKKANEMLAGMGININNIVNKNKGNLKATVVEFAKELDKLDPLARARAIETMFGKFQFARISTLLNNVTKDGNQASRVLDLAGQSASNLASITEKELGVTSASALVKFQAAMAKLKSSLAPVGEVFMKAFTPVIEFFTKILDKFNGLGDGTKKFVAIVVGVIGGLGPILLMTFGLLANGIANIIKLFATLRSGYQRLTGGSQNLGEQTQYLTMEQLTAEAAAHSLEQSHARLTQQFTVEATAVNQLRTAYQQALAAGASFAMMNPGMMRGPKKLAEGGIIRGPGTGTSDSIPAMLSNGEAVVSAKVVKKYPGLVNGLISGNVRAFANAGIAGGAPSGITFNGREYNIPVNLTALASIEKRLAKYSNDVAGVTSVLEGLERNAALLGDKFKKITGIEFKTIMNDSPAVRNNRPGVAQSETGLVKAHAMDRTEISDPTAIRNLYSSVQKPLVGPGKQVAEAVAMLDKADAARIALAKAEQERTSILARLEKANNDAQVDSLNKELMAVEQNKQAAEEIIKKANSLKLYVHSNYAFLVPSSANKGQTTPQDFANLYRGDNTQKTMILIYRQYAAQLGMTLSAALKNPTIAAQMHRDIGIFAESIAAELSQIPTTFVSDPQFYEAAAKAEATLQGRVSQVLIDAVTTAKAPGNVAAYWEGKDQTNRTAFTAEESALTTAFGGVPGTSSYSTPKNTLLEQQSVFIKRNVAELTPYIGLLDQLDTKAVAKLKKVENDLVAWKKVFAEEAQRLGITIGEAAVTGINTGAQTHSDSVATTKTGKDIDSGLAHGMIANESMVIAAGEKVGASAVASVDKGAKKRRRVVSSTQGAPGNIIVFNPDMAAPEGTNLLPIVAKDKPVGKVAGRFQQAKQAIKAGPNFKFSGGGLGSGMGMMAGSMALNALPDFTGKAVMQSTINMASMGAMFGPWGAAAGAAIGIISSGLSAIIAKQERQKAMTEAAFKSSESVATFFGNAVVKTDVNTINFNATISDTDGKLKKIAGSSQDAAQGIEAFKKMLDGLDKKDPLKELTDGLKDVSDPKKIQELTSAFVTMQVATGQIKPEQANQLVNNILSATGHAEYMGTVMMNFATQGEAVAAEIEVLKKGMKGFADGARSTADYITAASESNKLMGSTLVQLSASFSNLTSMEDLKLAIDAIKNSGLDAAAALDAMYAAYVQGKNIGQANVVKIVGGIKGADVSTVMAVQQAVTRGVKVHIDENTTLKSLQDEINAGYAKLGNSAFSSGKTALTIGEKQIANNQKQIDQLQSKKDKLEAILKKEQKIADEQKRQTDYLNKQQSLTQKIIDAKLKGNLVEAATLQQEQMGNTVDFENDQYIASIQGQIDKLDAQMKLLEKNNQKIEANTTATGTNSTKVDLLTKAIDNFIVSDSLKYKVFRQPYAKEISDEGKSTYITATSPTGKNVQVKVDDAANAQEQWQALVDKGFKPTGYKPKGVNPKTTPVIRVDSQVPVQPPTGYAAMKHPTYSGQTLSANNAVARGIESVTVGDLTYQFNGIVTNNKTRKTVGRWYGSPTPDSSGVSNSNIVIGYAGGGKVSGKGTSTSDSIPARLSNGEYVVRASAVKQYGPGFLDSINLQKFNTGGMVPKFDSSMSMPYGSEISSVLSTRGYATGGMVRENNSSTSNSNTVYNIDMTVNGGGADASEIADQVMRKIKLVASQNNKSNKVVI